MEALTAEYEEEEVEEEEEENAEAAESETALDEHQWSGEEPELDSPQAEPVNQAEAIYKAHDVDLGVSEADSAAAESSLDREEEEEVEGEESHETGVSCSLLSLPACYCISHLFRRQDVSKEVNNLALIQEEWQVILPALCCGCKATQACW